MVTGSRPTAVIFEIEGPARAVLTGERTALNFMQLLSATATAARVS
jgi:nicotinate-nucleotide pyrophosphorylase (carboxylating)